MAAKRKEPGEAGKKRVVRGPVVSGAGTITDTWGLGRKNNRAPNGDYLFGIAMKMTFPGCRPRTSRRVHQVPKNRTHLVALGTTYPLKGNPRDPKGVEIDWDSYERADGRKVFSRVVSRVAPVLRAAGYRKVTPRTFNSIKEDGLIHVIDFQASRWGDGFTVNAAVFLRELRRGYAYPVDEERIREENCRPKLRWRVGALMGTGRADQWWSYESPEETADGLIVAFRKHVLPHLKKYESRALIRQGWREAKRKAKGAKRPRVTA
jgi:hypothetical protein